MNQSATQNSPSSDGQRVRTLVGLWWLRLLAVSLHVCICATTWPEGGLCVWGCLIAGAGSLLAGLVVRDIRPTWWLVGHLGNLVFVAAWTVAATATSVPAWAEWLPMASIPMLTFWLVLTQQTLEQSAFVHMSRLSASWHLAWVLPLLAISVWQLDDVSALEMNAILLLPGAFAALLVAIQLRGGIHLENTTGLTAPRRDTDSAENTEAVDSAIATPSFVGGIREFWLTSKVRNAGIGLILLAGMLGLVAAAITSARTAASLHGPIEAIYLLVGLTFGLWEAGRWSDKKVEVGLAPWGGAALFVFGLIRISWGGLDGVTGISLVMLLLDAAVGFSAAFVLLPLQAWTWWSEKHYPRNGLHHQATSYSIFGIFAGAAIGRLLVENGVPEWAILSGSAIIVGIGAIWSYRLIPALAIRAVWWILCRMLYRIKVTGQENIPETGAVLLVPNHVSYIDGVLTLIQSPRMPRFMVYGDYTEMWALRWLAKVMSAIPIRNIDGPKAILRSLLEARETLKKGEVVAIFAEGQITKSGQINKFQPGMMKVLEGTDAVVVPVFLHGLWGSIFSFQGGKYFWKMPQRWRYPLSIHFGKPMPKPRQASDVQQAVARLGVAAMNDSQSDRLVPVRRFLRHCKRTKSREKVADSSGMKLTGARLLAGSLAFYRALNRKLARNEQHVGLLLPPSVGGCLANMAVALARRVSVNLNYTLTDEGVNYCIKEAGIKHVITSRKFLERKPIDIQGAEIIYLEDLKEQISGIDKAFAAACTYALPVSIVERMLGLTSIKPSDPCTIIFTSGSTGEPKGVVLTQDNIATNTKAIDDLIHLRSDDCLLGVLPFFHSFGYTVTFWLPMCYEPKGVYHFNPLDAKTVGALSEKHGVTILLTTPTFLRSWMRRCTTEQFHKLDVVVVGAEKMPLDLAREFEEKFGVAPTEGYGTTELSPLASVNIPKSRMLHESEPGAKFGTVGLRDPRMRRPRHRSRYG